MYLYGLCVGEEFEVGDDEECGVEIDDIGPRRDEGSACEVFGASVVGGDAEELCDTLLRLGQGFFWSSFSDDTDTVTGWRYGNESDGVLFEVNGFCHAVGEIERDAFDVVDIEHSEP